jgi:hypothetical protein
VGLLLDKAGHCIGFHLQALDPHLVLTGDRVGMPMIGPGLHTLAEEA